jgi:tripartite-type tricarboxylate transporter receptor subunit TctC
MRARSLSRGLVYGVLAMGCTMAASAPAPYPAKPIRLIVPIAAGSVTDVILRATSQELTGRLGQSIVIDNRAGASGIIGAEQCARATPDGYTICAVYTATTSANPYLFDKLPYDAQRDFAPVTNLYYVTGALVVHPALPASSIAELKSLATSRARALNFGTIGPGSYPELFLAWLNRQWGTSITAIPYKGGGPVAVALLGNEIQASAVGLGNFIPQVQAGQLRALAVSGSRRSRLLPAVPTMTEGGLSYPGHLWWGLAVPVATPATIVTRLNAEVVRLYREPRFVEFLENQAVEAAVGTPQEFAAFMQADRRFTETLIGARVR